MLNEDLVRIKKDCIPLKICTGQEILVQTSKVQAVQKHKWYMSKDQHVPSTTLVVPFCPGTMTDMTKIPRKIRVPKGGSPHPSLRMTITMASFLGDHTANVKDSVHHRLDPKLHMYHQETYPYIPDEGYYWDPAKPKYYRSRFRGVYIEYDHLELSETRPRFIYAAMPEDAESSEPLDVEVVHLFEIRKRLNENDKQHLAAELLAIEIRMAKIYDKEAFRRYGTNARVNFYSTLLQN